MWRFLLAVVILSFLAACAYQQDNADVPRNTEPTVSTPSVVAAVTPLATSRAISAPSASILKAFPLEVGRTWMYSVTKEYAPISPNGEITFVDHTGVITETVVAMHQDDASLVFTSTLQAVPDSLNDPFDQVRRYEVKDNAIFFNNHVTLLHWPLTVNQEWDAFGDVAKDFRGVYFWHVVKQEPVTVPAGHFENCFQLLLQTNPDHSIDWLCAGIGIVRKEYHHHGTVDNQYWELQSTQAP